MKDDAFGDRMKDYESRETARRFIPMLPIYARIDGKTFATFTKGLARPFDHRLSRAMIETTKYLVEATNANIGYTQSDEINLVWGIKEYGSEIIFNGKIQKLCSVLASQAAAKFGNVVARHDDPAFACYANDLPAFDCRVFQLPNLIEAANVILWREMDATKNAVSMAARAYFSHEELQRKSGPTMQEMLFGKGINFNDYPNYFKRGTFVRRVNELVTLPPNELAAIPESFRPADGRAMRSRIVEVDMPSFSKVINRDGVIFGGFEPIVGNQI